MLQSITIPEQQPIFNGGYFAWNFATGKYELFAIPANSHLVALVAYIPAGSEFDGTTPAAKVGIQGDDDDGFFTNAEIALGTAGLKIWRPLADIEDTDTDIEAAAASALDISSAGGNTYADDTVETAVDVAADAMAADIIAKTQTAFDVLEGEVNALKAALRKIGLLGDSATGYDRIRGYLATAEKIVEVDFTKAGGTPTKGECLIYGVYNTLYQMNLVGMPL